MIVIKLMGGMGNQMFQYAFASYLAHKHSTEIKFDLSYLDERENIGNRVIRHFDLDIFGIEKKIVSPDEARRMTERTGFKLADKLLDKLIGEKKSYLKEKSVNFSAANLNTPSNVYLKGYFASEKYFASIRDEIKKTFTVTEPLMVNSAGLLKEIQNGNSVCVNIRRGDFITNPTHNICNEEYYYGAEKILTAKKSDLHFYVFSDDVEWCSQNLKFSVPTTFVTHDYKGKKFQDYFRLMSACRHFIIPNSTFAWWATYLNSYSDKVVVAPKRWLNIPDHNIDDIIPETWIKLDV